jgi:ribosomal protein S18 acetylase RimI-like enzyme
MQPITFAVDAPVTPGEVCDLREAVGWGRQESDYPAAFARYYATVSGRDDAGALVAWCAVLSDGVRHAVLLDVIVHPAQQRRGIGRALVRRAIDHIQARGISIIHVDFIPAHRHFYESCGFTTGLGGIIDFSMQDTL